MYARPSASAADAQFPSTAYTRPSASAADAQFQTPFVATGFTTTLFGVPSATQIWYATALSPTANVGVPAAVVRLPAFGAQATRFGTPTARNYRPVPMPRVAQAIGFNPTNLGGPAAVWRQSAAAVGFTAPVFGTPTAVRVQSAAGFLAPSIGSPTARLVLSATGFRSTTSGLPTARLSLQATGFATARLGTPSAFRPGARTARSMGPLVRVGTPLGFNDSRRRATGFITTTAGTPAARLSFQASSIAPTTNFGTALVVRSTSC